MKLTQWVVVLVVIGMAGIALPAAAQSSEPGADLEFAVPNGPPENFGAGVASYPIHISAFNGRNGANTWSYVGAGRVTRATGTDLMWAPVNLPNGAVIDLVEAFVEDTGAGTITIWLTRFFGTNSIQDIASVSTVGTPGATTISFAPNHTVDNTTNLYVVYMSIPVDATLITKGMRIRYRLQVSPAPATATFTDVPTGHPQFRFVQALVAAGVTGGCGAGLYCPDQAVTRGQMAVFLSVALGLHFPF